MTIQTNTSLCTSFATNILLTQTCFYDFIDSSGGTHQNICSKAIYAKNDGVVTGGVRGNDAIDFQTSRTTCDQVAAGAMSTILGGHANKIHCCATVAGIGGGACNTVDSSGCFGIIGGGYCNYINGCFSFIGGGCGNNINSCYSTIAGGAENYIGTSSSFATVGGGYQNRIEDNSCFAALGGGYGNKIGCTANNCCACYATIIGGCQNCALCPFSNVLGGALNVSCGFHSVVSGNSNLAGGDFSLAMGECNCATGCGAFAVGYKTKALGHFAVAMGNQSCAGQRGEVAFANGIFSSLGDAQHGHITWLGQTTDATPTKLTLDNSSLKYEMPDKSVYTFNVKIIGYKTNVTAGNVGSYFFHGTMKKINGNISLVGSILTDYSVEDDATWNATVSFTNEASVGVDNIEIVVTGAASNTIRWVAGMEYSRVVGT